MGKVQRKQTQRLRQVRKRKVEQVRGLVIGLGVLVVILQYEITHHCGYYNIESARDGVVIEKQEKTGDYE